MFDVKSSFAALQRIARHRKMVADSHISPAAKQMLFAQLDAQVASLEAELGAAAAAAPGAVQAPQKPR